MTVVANVTVDLDVCWIWFLQVYNHECYTWIQLHAISVFLNSHYNFHSGCVNLNSHQQWTMSFLSPHPHRHFCHFFFKFWLRWEVWTLWIWFAFPWWLLASFENHVLFLCPLLIWDYFFLNLFYVCECVPMGVYVHHMYAVLMEARRGRQISWN